MGNTKALDFALEKTAGMFGNMGNVMGHIGKGMASADAETAFTAAGQMGKMGLGAAKFGAGAILGVWGAKKIIEGLMNDHTRKALLEDLLLNDIIISQADPEKVKSFYATIHHLAPKLSADKNIVRELLQNFVKFDRVDMNSIKAMVDTQKSMSSGESSMMTMFR